LCAAIPYSQARAGRSLRREQRRREGLGGQIGGQLRVAGPAQEESEDRGKMSPIEIDERIGLARNEA